MPLEIEAKLKVESHEGVREKLREAGAVYVGKVLETNIFFDRADGGLRGGNRGLRIRLEKVDGKEKEKGLLTYKEPPQKDGLGSREALDVTIEPPEQAISLLEVLGFGRVMSFEKWRESWAVSGCKVELDELPEFGLFVEVEGPSEERVLDVRSRLGLDGAPLVKQGYASMMGELVRKRGVGTAVTF